MVVLILWKLVESVPTCFVRLAICTSGLFQSNVSEKYLSWTISWSACSEIGKNISKASSRSSIYIDVGESMVTLDPFSSLWVGI